MIPRWWSLLVVVVSALLVTTVQASTLPLSPVNIGLPANAHIVCFGDFNSDKHTDVFLVTDDQQQLLVYLWNHAAQQFEALSTAVLSDSGMPITAAAASDYDHDGRLDILLAGPSNTTINTTTPQPVWDPTTNTTVLVNVTVSVLANTTRHHIYLGQLSYFAPLPYIVTPEADDQVLVLDANNDLLVDLFGSVQSVRGYWINTNTNPLQYTFTPQTVSDGSALLPLSSPHSSGFVDLDGDCLSDLFVTAWNANSSQAQYEIWLNKKTSVPLFQQSFPVRQGAGQVTFADFDGDGTMDVLFPVCSPADTCAEENSIHIFYNAQKPMCSSAYSSTSSCRPQQQLCTADLNFAFDPDWSLNRSLTATHVVVEGSEAFGGASFQTGRTGVDGSVLPLTLRQGDIDLDGYADLLVPLQSTASGSAGGGGGGGSSGITYLLSLFSNVPCSLATCDAAAVAAGRRTFVRSTAGTATLEAIPAAYAGAFFDLDDSGELDILVLTATPPSLNTTITPPTPSSSSSPSSSTIGLHNNCNEDAYFLTTVGCNGVCPAWCPSSPTFPNPKPYGVNHPGVSVKFTVTSLEGTKRVVQGAQSSQSSYLALLTPYSLFGLGRTNNYIEEFYVGVPLSYAQHFQMWVAVIPNSQLIVFPYQPDQPNTWTLEWFISPSTRLLYVLIAIVSSCVALVAVIAVFHWRERKQDNDEKKQTEHLFAF